MAKENDEKKDYSLKAETGKYMQKGGDVNFKIKRGDLSWTYIYVALGFAIAIEGTFIEMTPLPFPYNLIIYILVGALTFWLFICNARFQNILISMKLGYESKER